MNGETNIYKYHNMKAENVYLNLIKSWFKIHFWSVEQKEEMLHFPITYAVHSCFLKHLSTVKNKNVLWFQQAIAIKDGLNCDACMFWLCYKTQSDPLAMLRGPHRMYRLGVLTPLSPVLYPGGEDSEEVRVWAHRGRECSTAAAPGHNAGTVQETSPQECTQKEARGGERGCLPKCVQFLMFFKERIGVMYVNVWSYLLNMTGQDYIRIDSIIKGALPSWRNAIL